MKTLLLLSFLVFSLSVNAKTYYLSSSGDDTNSGTDISSPWQTLNKINNFKGFVAGDNILFRRGDTFYGKIIISNSGSPGNPLTFGAYGSGANPVITGFTNATSWINKGGNIWESSSPVSSLRTCNMVVINGKNTPMGRYPNTGYLTYQSYVNNTSITSSSLTGTPDWTGADASIRANRWTVNRVTISSQSGGTLTFPAMSGNGINNFGFFIENDIRTLDAQNEWYYNPSTKKISVYSTSQPTNVMVASVDTLMIIAGSRNYHTINNINFQGANQILLYDGGSYTNISNCNYSFGAWDGLQMAGNYDVIDNNTFSDIGGNAVFMNYGSPGYNTITNNIFRRINLITGVLENDYTAAPIRCYSANSLVQYNDIDSCGYNGIQFKYNNVQIRNNLVNHAALVRDDAGGIYTGFANETGKVIDGNIILNTVGNYDGTDGSGYLAHGIYIDDLGTGVTITNNTIANCSNTGIFLHNANNCNVRNNTIYNCGTTPAVFTKGALYYKHESGYTAIANNTIKNNIFFSKEQGQIPYFSSDNTTDAPISYGVMDSNYYAKPLSADANIFSVNSNVGGSTTYYNLTQWQSSMGMDAHSKGSPKSIKDVNDLRFEYNATNSNKTISLDAKYIDVKGNVYNGSISLAPYTSSVLIKDGPISTNKLPVATAGKDQAITLPVNIVQLLGNGSDADGTIVSYSWAKISGPSAGSIANANSASTTVSGMVAGVYQFELKVTDNQGGVGKDTVSVTVNAAVNIPPKAIAGNDLSVNLPTNTITLSGSGTDIDGSIMSYQWTKILGPSNFNIVNGNLAVTEVSGLVQGMYQFELKVTDNSGGIGKDTVQVTVNAAANIAPTANAGTDKTITLPASTTTLTGSGSAPNGSIKSYQWTKISGPSNFNIVNGNLAVTDVSGLMQGVYQFELKVTDNSGGIGRDTVQVTINAAANVAPTANAGSAKTITLPVNTTTLSGSGSAPNGSIKSFQWTKISGPSSFNIVNPLSPVTEVSGLVQGTYQFELSVTDNQGVIGKSTVQIVVNAANNILPTSNAGLNQSIELPTNTISLSGSGTDPDGQIASYKWTKISGPASFNIVNSLSPVTEVTGLVQGIYQFELAVTDNSGGIGKDTIQISVNKAASTPTALSPNIAPTAYAGNDTTIIAPVSSINLAGSGTDPDGTIVSFLWSQIAGPTATAISPATGAVTTISNLEEGTYVFELTVTDNAGAKASDTIKVTVALGRLARESSALTIYPNPVHDIATLKINTGKFNTNLMIVITDMSGKAVYKEQFVSGNSEDKKQINMSNLTKGAYIVTVFFDGMQGQSVKVIKL